MSSEDSSFGEAAVETDMAKIQENTEYNRAVYEISFQWKSVSVLWPLGLAAVPELSAY